MNLKNLTIGMVAASLLMLGACSSQKDPAAAAVTSAEASLAEIKADASKFAAEELAAVEASVASMKASYDKKDYDKVVADAPTVNSSIDMLKSNVSAKIDQNNAAAAEWATLSTDVPALVQALDSRLSTLSTARRLPKGIDKPGLTLDAGGPGVDEDRLDAGGIGRGCRQLDGSRDDRKVREGQG